jgi:2-epi-valiolone-7-phosphate 1-reductase
MSQLEAAMKRGNTHKALVGRGNGLRIATVPTGSPGAGGLLIAPLFVGVCGTDLQILNGARPDTASILGHEGAGVVVEAGPGATLHAGQYIVFNPSAQLPRGRILGHNIDGLFQRYIVVDAQAVSDGLAQPMEEDLPAICGALVEPLGGVIYAHELIAKAVPDLESVAVFGAGPIGLVMAEYLRGTGSSVLLLHSGQTRLNTAVERKLVPASSTMTISDGLPERMLDWNGARYFDAAVICTSMAGASVALGHAVKVVKSGGCIEMVTNYPKSSPTPDGISADALRQVRAANICGIPLNGEYVGARICGRRIAFTSHRGTSWNHLNLAMRALGSRASQYTALITHVLPLGDAVTAIQSLASTRGAPVEGRDCIKAVIDMTLDA